MYRNIIIIIIAIIIGLGQSPTLSYANPYQFDFKNKNHMRGAWFLCGMVAFSKGECPKVFRKCWQPPLLEIKRKGLKTKIVTTCWKPPSFKMSQKDIADALAFGAGTDLTLGVIANQTVQQSVSAEQLSDDLKPIYNEYEHDFRQVQNQAEQVERAREDLLGKIEDLEDILEEAESKPQKSAIMTNLKAHHAEREIEQARQNLAKEEQELDAINNRLAEGLDVKISQFMEGRGIGRK